jgi:hypothetical protein
MAPGPTDANACGMGNPEKDGPKANECNNSTRDCLSDIVASPDAVRSRLSLSFVGTL